LKNRRLGGRAGRRFGGPTGKVTPASRYRWRPRQANGRLAKGVTSIRPDQPGAVPGRGRTISCAKCQWFYKVAGPGRCGVAKKRRVLSGWSGCRTSGRVFSSQNIRSFIRWPARRCEKASGFVRWGGCRTSGRVFSSQNIRSFIRWPARRCEKASGFVRLGRVPDKWAYISCSKYTLFYKVAGGDRRAIAKNPVLCKGAAALQGGRRGPARHYKKTVFCQGATAPKCGRRGGAIGRNVSGILLRHRVFRGPRPSCMVA